MATFTWEPSLDSTLPTAFLLERSVDNGLSWTTIVTIPYDTSGGDYDSATGMFIYVDAGTVAGEMVRVQAVDSGDPSRDSAFRYSHGDSAIPATIHLYGAVIDAATGEPRNGLEVRVNPISELSTTTVPAAGSQATVPGITPATLMGMKRETKVFTDDQGNWSLDLLRDLPIQVEIPAVQFMTRFRTPTDRDILNINDAYAYRIGDDKGLTPFEFGGDSGFTG